MPYNPQVQPRGDVYLNRAISSLGENIGTAIKEYRQRREESQFLDQQAEGLATAAAPLVQSGALDQAFVDDMAKFPELSLSQKRAKAASTLFLIDRAQKQADSQRDEGYRKANLELARGRFLVDAQRENRVAEGDARQARFNEGLAGYLDTPEMIRRPADEAVPYLAAQAGIATPETIDRMTSNDLRRKELDVRDRAVGVQERLAGVSEGKLDAAGGPKPIDPVRIEGMKNAIILQLTDPLKTTSEEARKVLRERLAHLEGLQGMLPSTPTAGGGGNGAGTKTGGARVKVVSPDGKVGTIPEGQLDAAIKKGFKRAD